MNGCRVIEVDSLTGAMRELYVEGQNPETDCGIYFEQIKSIVTHEMFNNIKYEVE